MPEMLKPTSLIMGAGLGQDVASLTDGRFSGGWVTRIPHRNPVAYLNVDHMVSV
jgi:dihydroxyacid dehydratase/phosphogluconate dehydratase